MSGTEPGADVLSVLLAAAVAAHGYLHGREEVFQIEI